ncbi:hypothetical protein PL75_01810 [Neisseria arctica]|uniref:Uncharacterized protein n=1 Tax=Neisseria arctica TaxID=1470200 RepID=A0A0J1C5R9_9NEIS|nr:hypothetical protein [Neisseria arctica]KLT73703.1 hypothetical protein PL75_01810 [Neisseria arctica]UOO85838.1 hypothetical protein LVJ86_06235 [Neisseria arctica]
MSRHYHHIWGVSGQFVRLEGRYDWWPLNDPLWVSEDATNLDFYFSPETSYLANTEKTPSPEKLLAFSQAAREIARKKLDAVAKLAVAQNLRASQEAYDLERLIASIDHFMRQDDLYR